LENYGWIVSLISVGLATAYFRKNHSGATRFQKFLQAIVVVVVAGAAGVGANLGGQYLRYYTGTPSSADAEKAMRAVKAYPLLSQALADNPAIEEKVRKAIDDWLRNPTHDQAELAKLGAAIRTEYIVPALRSADDPSAVAATDRLKELALYLQSHDQAMCFQLGERGIQNVNDLDVDGRAIFQLAVAAQEVAYRAGKNATSRHTPITNEAAGELLADAGYQLADFETLQRFNGLSARDGCAATVKLYSAPGQLPLGKGGALARHLLAPVD